MTDRSTMNFRVKLRLVALVLGIGLMGLVIVLMTLKSQRQAEELRVRLDQKDSESFQIAQQFRDFLDQLNSALFHYGGENDAAELEKFNKASDDLNQWIDVHSPRLTTVDEKAIMNQIDAAYDDYLAAAKALLIRLKSLGPQSATVHDYADVRKQSERLFDLGMSLERAHYYSRGLLVAHANKTITQLRVLVLASLSCIFAFGVALAWVVYRDMIAPLRVKLVESQALMERQEKLVSLGMLAAGVAHEIRNPLTAIKAALFIQQKKFRAGTQEFDDARLVEREILRLERIVNDFLLFARPAEPEMANLTPAALFQEIQSLFGHSLAGNHIQLRIEESPPLRIRADAAQIKQVLINLVQNAADAIDRDGVITLRARRDRKRLANVDTNVVVLEVVDDGKGIPPEVQQRLFDPFFTTKDSGTGLGLSIAAGIVQKHGGALQYQTQLDYGTTFGILLLEPTE
jgi:signal transduction histidine kinase